MVLREIERHGEDGYALVADFMFDQESRGHSIEKDLKQGEKSAYIGSLIRSRPERDFPVWEFVEAISFGWFVHFSGFALIGLAARK